jgi:RNA polymerase sigma-70 factor (ECF subfamily)
MGAETAEIEAVYRAEFRRFVRVATAITGSEERGLDAVQDAFARALRHRRGFRGAGPLEAWLWRTVVNCARRSRRGERPVEPPGPNGSPEHDRELRALVAALPERQRHVLFLRYYADLDYRAISEALEISTGTVGAALNAAHATLRLRLQEVER